MHGLAINPPLPATRIERTAAVAGIAVTALILAAFARHLAAGAAARGPMPFWLALHLATIVPAMPLGAFVLARPKGDRLHRMAGRIWVGLMLVAALSSFGLVGLMGHLSPIHLLSALVLVSVPRAVLNARAGRIMAHRRGMTIVYASSCIAGLFVFIPSRMLGGWLFG